MTENPARDFCFRFFPTLILGHTFLWGTAVSQKSKARSQLKVGNCPKVQQPIEGSESYHLVLTSFCQILARKRISWKLFGCFLQRRTKLQGAQRGRRQKTYNKKRVIGLFWICLHSLQNIM